MDAKLEELEKSLAESRGPDRVDLLIELGNRVFQTDPRTGLEYADEAQDLAQKLNYKSGLAESYRLKGNINIVCGDLDQALIHHNGALKIYQTLKDQKGMANAFSGMALVYTRRGVYDSAFNYYFRALSIYEEFDDKRKIALTFNNIGNTFSFQENWQKSIEYHLKALRIREELDDRNRLSLDYNNLGNRYVELKDYETGLDYLLKALKITEEFNDQLGLARAYNNIGRVHRFREEYEQALDYFLRSVAVQNEIENKECLPYTYSNMGDVYMQMGQYDQAQDYLSQSLEINRQTGDKYAEMRDHELLLALHQKQGDYKQAFESLHNWNILNQMIFNAEKSKQITELQIKYETEKNRRTIEQLEQQLEKQDSELRMMAQRLIQRNELVEQLHSEIATIMDENTIENILSILKNSTHQQQDWERFKKKFDVFYPDFLHNLAEGWPELTRQELRICALTKIGLSSGDIAKTLFISDRTVTNHRYHINRKIQLPEGQSLPKFLASFGKSPRNK